MTPPDHAAVLATAVFQITAASSIPEAERRLHIENLVREELDEVRREAISDRRVDDA